MPSRFVLKALELSPSAFFHVIDDVRPEKYRDRIAPDRFDLVETIAHLADLEDLVLERMRLACEHPGSTCVEIDPDARAMEKRYAERDLHHELDVFRNRRNDTLDFLANLPAGEETKSIVHPAYGEISIEYIAHSMLAHDMYHLEQASQYLR